MNLSSFQRSAQAPGSHELKAGDRYQILRSIMPMAAAFWQYTEPDTSRHFSRGSLFNHIRDPLFSALPRRTGQERAGCRVLSHPGAQSRSHPCSNEARGHHAATTEDRRPLPNSLKSRRCGEGQPRGRVEGGFGWTGALESVEACRGHNHPRRTDFHPFAFTSCSSDSRLAGTHGPSTVAHFIQMMMVGNGMHGCRSRATRLRRFVCNVRTCGGSGLSPI